MNAYELLEKSELGGIIEALQRLTAKQSKRIEELEKHYSQDEVHKVANKLREGSKDPNKWSNMMDEAMEMILTLQHRIEKLENSIKVNYECSSMKENKPVAYWDGKHFASKEKSSLADIPFYTHPHKELSDEEIINVWFSIGESESIKHQQVKFARACIKSSRGEK